MIGALLIDPRPAGLLRVCEELAEDVLDAGARCGWPEVGPLCGIYTPQSEVCWRHWVEFRLEWAWAGVYAWPEYELLVLLGHLLDRLERERNGAASEGHAPHYHLAAAGA